MLDYSMALAGLQNYTFPLTLLGEVTVRGDLNTKDIYVSGTVTGAGISADILGEDNTWKGTNDFQNVSSYTGTIPATQYPQMLTKKDIDDAVLAYNPLPTSNNWGEGFAPVPRATFSNANPPVLPIIPGPSGAWAGNNLFGYTDMQTLVSANLVQNQTGKATTYSGINTFGTVQVDSTIVPSLLEPTLPQQAVAKGYIDGKVELSGKSIMFQILTPGTYNFTDATLTGGSLGNIGKIDYWLFSGSCGGASGAVVSGTIGNGQGIRGSIFLTVGTTAAPAVVYTVQDTTVPSTTSLSVSGQLIAVADGACNLNGVLTPGVVGSTSMTTQGTSCNGQLASNNVLDYSNLLGTTTSAGGCLFVAYYI